MGLYSSVLLVSPKAIIDFLSQDVRAKMRLANSLKEGCRMIVFMDGGTPWQARQDGSCTLSWGMVVHHNDKTTEVVGCKTDVNPRFRRGHEQLALIEASRHIMSHSVEPSAVSFFTDDKWVCDMSRMLQSGGEMPSEKDKGYRVLAGLCGQYYDRQTLEYCHECMRQSRFTKVRGHKGSVYNLRCDYLARIGQHQALGESVVPERFEDWLERGFPCLSEDSSGERWYPSFTGQHL
jgi:ribonuclease HI